jgi:site-specific DNA-cytosine methylase
MKVLELFAGTASFSRAARVRGHQTFTTDIDPQFECDWTCDIMDLDASFFSYDGWPNVIWASPPCETFSVASIGTHWTGGKNAYEPKTVAAKEGIQRVLRTIDIIEEAQPEVFIIENPRGVLRKMPFMQGFYRHTVTYCQYGDTRMKPTELWSNIALDFKPMCKNGDPCHERAPRGSKTGTQGIKGYRDRSRVPEALCVSILEQIESRLAAPEETEK